MMDEKWMRIALEEAEAALREGEIPVGAVLVCGEQEVARAHNQKESLRDPTAHAEILVLRTGSARLGRWRLEDCVLYVTTEPCLMCWGAILEARVPVVVYGGEPVPRDLPNLTEAALRQLEERVLIRRGVFAEEAARLMRRFFAARRQKRKMAGEVAESG